jgi:hypothetical protein
MLVEQPTLSKHVRKLDLILHHVTEDRPMTATRAVATTNLQNTVEELRLPSPITADWKCALECADCQAFAANILFSTFRTLEDLSLRYDHCRFED